MFALTVPATSDNHNLPRFKTGTESTERIAKYARSALSDATWHAYENDLAHFRQWGGDIPASPEVVASYLAEYGGELAISTLVRRLAALTKAHEMAGYPSPTDIQLVRLTMKGIKRRHSTKQAQAAPLLRDDLVTIINKMSGDVKGVRDAALLLLGLSAALRRSELVALNIDDLDFSDKGLVITIKQSKTDQEGWGRKIAVPYGRSRICPVRKVRSWLDILDEHNGPVFRGVRKGGHITCKRLSDGAVSSLIKHHVSSIGMEPTIYSGHSLRSGFITTAAQMGVPEWKIMKQSGHKSHQMVFRYIRDARLFEDHPLDSIF